MNASHSDEIEPSRINPIAPSAPSPYRSVHGGGNDDDDLDLWFVKDFSNILRRRWPLLTVITLVVAGVTLAWCLAMKPLYEADATILVQSRQSSQPSQMGAMASILGISGGGSSVDLPTQMEIMTSDVELQSVSDRLHLGLTPLELRKEIDIKVDKDSTSVLDIAVRDPSAKTAVAIVNTLLAVYKRSLGAEDATVIGHSAELVRQQVAATRKSLSAAEDKLALYSGRMGSIAPDTDEEKRVAMLYSLQTDFLEAQQKLGAAKASRDYYISELSKMPSAIVPALSFERNPRIDTAKQQLNALEEARAGLATMYTPNDDEMVQNQKQIDAVNQQIVAEREAQDNGSRPRLSGAPNSSAAPGYVVAGGTQELNPARQAAQASVIDAEASMDAAQANLDAIKSAIGQVKSRFSSVPMNVRRMMDLRDDAGVLQKEYDGLREQYANLEASRGEDQTYISMLQVPLLPKKPAFPRPILFTAAAFIGGLFLGALAIIGLEALDPRVRSGLDIRSEVGVSELITLSRLGIAKGSSKIRLDTSEAREVRLLASTLTYLGLGKRYKSILVTSVVSGEGATFTATELALALANEGKRVILVDANLRQPSLHTYFGLANSSGLAGAMRNGAHPEKALVPIKGEHPLQLVPGGDLDNESVSQILNPEKVVTLLSALKERADVVLLDAPAVFQGLETSMLVDKVDACLLVTAVGHAQRSELKRAALLLTGHGGPLLGVVLNKGASKKNRGKINN